MRKIVIDAEKCVGCGDCSLMCPVKVYNRWKDLGEDSRRRISELSLEERNINFADVQSARAAKKAERLAAKVFAYLDMKSCLGCMQCGDSCWKEAITVITDEN